MADTKPCCICGAEVAPPYHLIGQRVYCARHFATVNKPHPGYWRSGLVQIVGMGVFALLAAWVANNIGPLNGTALIVAGVLLAIVPTLLWLLFFYREDRLEPEPKTKILLVFGAALLVADFVGRRMLGDWFRISDWATRSTTSLLAYVFIVGMIWQVTAYIAVRLVLTSDEFDERMDGIVYGTVAGLGVATLLNLRYVLDNGGVALGPGVIHTVTTALAQASFGGVMGYFVAEAKFAHKPLLWVPLGFALAAIGNGFFTWLIGEVGAVGLSISPLRSLILGVIVAVVVFFILIALMRRSVAVTMNRAAIPGSK